MSHDMTKPTKWLCAQRRLRSAWADWSESSLSAWRKFGSLASHWAHSEDSDQTGRIWVFAGRTLILLVLSCRGSNANDIPHDDNTVPPNAETHFSYSRKPIDIDTFVQRIAHKFYSKPKKFSHKTIADININIECIILRVVKIRGASNK